MNKNDVQDHFEKLYRTTTEATKARISARLKQNDRENDDPYDPYKFDRLRVDEAASQEFRKKQSKPVSNQKTRSNQNEMASKAGMNGECELLDDFDDL